MKLLDAKAAAIAALTPLALAMIVWPLPTLLLDLLLGANLALSLLAAWQVSRGRTAFAALPGLLVAAALARCLLHIAATRLIVAHAEAGWWIEAMARAAALDEPLVGVALLLIVLLVQLLVVIKGGERIAEVAARFRLDALPGQQLAIDAEVRQGMLSAREAMAKREELVQRSQTYGALDGAMKLTKGEAIAAVAFAAVNLLGGWLLAVAVRGEDAGESAQTLSLLAVGEGLATQLPALLLTATVTWAMTRREAAEEQRRDVSLLLQVPTARLAECGGKRALERRLGMLSASLDEALGLSVLLRIRKPNDDRTPTQWSLAGVDYTVTTDSQADAAAWLQAVEASLRQHADELLSLDVLEQHLGTFGRTHGALLRQTVPARLSLPGLAELLRQLLREGVGLQLLPRVLETVASLPTPLPPSSQLLQKVREGLAPWFSMRLAPQGTIAAWLLEPAIEEAVREASLDPDLALDVQEAVLRACTPVPNEGSPMAPLLSQGDVRAQVWQLLAPRLPALTVLSYRELLPQVQIRTLGRVQIG